MAVLALTVAHGLRLQTRDCDGSEVKTQDSGLTQDQKLPFK